MKRAISIALLYGGVAHADFASRVVGDERTAERSAEVVTVTPLADEHKQSSDLGTVIDRVQGVRVARQGGLGGEATLSLDGFSGDQIRLFLDGAPLELAGFSFGLANVPVTLVDRIELYRGVVPLRFGADALGGALNLVSSTRHYGTGVSGSLQIGSFSTVRASGSAHVRDDKTGIYGAVTTFVDYTRNDYDVDVQVSDAAGRLHDATVPRFHDAYAARGVVVEGGVVGKAVHHLTVRGHYSEYDKDLQSNPIMTSPYGAVRYGEKLGGISLVVDQPGAFGRGIDLDAVLSYSHRATSLHDRSDQVYDWYGRAIFTRPQPGEIDGVPLDTTLWRDDVYARLGVAAALPHAMRLRVSTTATYDRSHGLSRTLSPGEIDPLAGDRTHLKIVSGIEHTADLWDRVENIAFLKHYHLRSAAQLSITGSTLQPVANEADEAGGGDAVRVKLYRDALWLKASYEYATRLPAATEIFGDGILVLPNAQLAPETSHNVNLSLDFDVPTRGGRFGGSLAGFFRQARDLIVLLGTANGFTYQNVYDARVLGVDGTLRFRSPGEYFVFESTATYQDLRNVSTAGPYADLRGDRLPNQPWLFVHAMARLQHKRLGRRHDELSLSWYTKYVHAFTRDWESLGAPAFRPTVDAQLSHTLSVVYLLRVAAPVSFAFDLENLTDAKLFDVYGVQRPGRAAYGKVTFAY